MLLLLSRETPNQVPPEGLLLESTPGILAVTETNCRWKRLTALMCSYRTIERYRLTRSSFQMRSFVQLQCGSSSLDPSYHLELHVYRFACQCSLFHYSFRVLRSPHYIPLSCLQNVNLLMMGIAFLEHKLACFRPFFGSFFASFLDRTFLTGIILLLSDSFNSFTIVCALDS